MLFGNNIDLNRNELLNARIQQLAVAPSSPVEGLIYYNTVDHALYIYNGSAFVVLGSQIVPALTGDVTTDGATNVTSIAAGVIVNADINASAAIALSKLAVDPLARANHTGSQAISTITNLQTTLDAKLALAGGTMSGAIDMGGYGLTNLPSPSASSDAATKSYVDAVKQGLDIKDSVRVATTANITLSGTQTIDGVTLSAGQRVLVKNQSTASENGIWVVASGAWSRASDAIQGNVTSGMYTYVEEGTSQAQTGWVLSTSGSITVGTTNLTFSQFNGAGSVVAGNGLSRSGNTLSVLGTASRISVSSSGVDIDPGYVGQTSITTLGTIGAGTWQGTAVGVLYGGTGASTAASARSNLGAAGKYSADIGDGSTTSFVITHNLGSQDAIVRVYDKSSPYAEIDVDIRHTSSNSITVVFSSVNVPTTNQYRVVVLA